MPFKYILLVINDMNIIINNPIARVVNKPVKTIRKLYQVWFLDLAQKYVFPCKHNETAHGSIGPPIKINNHVSNS